MDLLGENANLLYCYKKTALGKSRIIRSHLIRVQLPTAKMTTIINHHNTPVLGELLLCCNIIWKGGYIKDVFNVPSRSINNYLLVVSQLLCKLILLDKSWVCLDLIIWNCKLPCWIVHCLRNRYSIWTTISLKEVFFISVRKILVVASF